VRAFDADPPVSRLAPPQGRRSAAQDPISKAIKAAPGVSDLDVAAPAASIQQGVIVRVVGGG
jgi:hypothetical protein